MQVGDSFVLNCLGEDGLSADETLLETFPPGADRFEGVIETGTGGSPILADAVSYVECKVVSRMDANDHWVIYSEAYPRGVFNKDAKRRRTRKLPRIIKKCTSQQSIYPLSIAFLSQINRPGVPTDLLVLSFFKPAAARTLSSLPPTSVFVRCPDRYRRRRRLFRNLR